MKYSLLFLLAIVIAIFFYLNRKDKRNNLQTGAETLKASGIKWNDSLFKYFNQAVDTSIVVRDSNNHLLKFSQFIKPVFNHEAMIYQDKGVWRLQYFTQRAVDALQKDDYAVDRAGRMQAYRTIDTVKSWKIKLAAIAQTLKQADYILALKHKRELYLMRKGKPIFILPLSLGFSPDGNKVTDGDGKTPEGLYHLDIKYERNDKYYKSFWISYPNEQEKVIAKRKGIKLGSGIMIHGTKPDIENKKDWTAGCIALQNSDMDTLFKYVANGTLIEIRK